MSKTILITGAAKRVGRAMALHYAAQGWHVAAHYGSSQSDADSLHAEITSGGGRVSLFQADFTQGGAAQNLFDAVSKTCGAPQVLINNAARFERDDGGITEHSLHAHMAVNATTPIILAQSMRKGIVVNILDRTLDWSWPHLPAYVLSKRALEEWTVRNCAAFQPDVFVFGLRLGPTLRNQRESEQHFSQAISAHKVTLLDDILRTIDAAIAQPTTHPAFTDL